MIYFVFASTKRGVIGIGNKLPWSIRDELRMFQKITNRKTVLMGRKTYDSIGKPLQNRTNLVLTRSPEIFKALHSQQNLDKIEIVTDVDPLVKKYLGAKDDDLYVIGGAEVFLKLQNSCDGAYISWIKKDYSGDTFFNFPNIKHFFVETFQSNVDFTTKLYLKEKNHDNQHHEQYTLLNKKGY